MLAVLSPAKRLEEGPALAELPHAQPALIDDVAALVQTARTLDAADLRELMEISDSLADLNVRRFQTFSLPLTPTNARQAARMFAGDTYLGFDAPSLGADDLVFAQSHVAILSGLYGVLRPLDLMQPYRLEMGTRLTNPRGKDLYAFWGDRIARRLDAMLQGHTDRTVVNLASHEYFSAVDTSALDARVVTPVFQEVKDGKARVLQFYAKKARGSMARYAVVHRLEQAEALKTFDSEGYAFQPELSDDTRWVFQRPQPDPKR